MTTPELVERRKAGATVPPAVPPAAATTDAPAPPKPKGECPPFLLDFYPLESPEQTRVHRFYERLREGRLSTTRCPKDHTVHWPPRVACPECHREELEWIDLPERGRVYAFSAVLAGAPLGMESDVPFVVGLVDLDGSTLRLFGRIEGTTWQACRIGQPVSIEPYTLPDARVFYRFRALS